MANQLGFKDVKVSGVECDTCIELIKTNSYSSLSFKSKQLPCAPCYFAVLDYPHTCTLQMLIVADTAYNFRSITLDLYKKWISLNSLNYHTSDSAYALSVWDTRLDFLKEEHASYPDMLLKSSSVRVIQEVWIGKPWAIIPYLCKKHAVTHIKFDTRYSYKNTSASKLHVLINTFQPPTAADAKKISIPITALVAQMLSEGHLDIVNKVFSVLPVTTYESICVMQLVNALGNPYYDKMYELMVSDGMCCMSPDQYGSYFKAIGVAVRRSSRWVDGTNLPGEAVCYLSYWEMCLGRMTSQSDWVEEKRKRCGEYMFLKPPDHIGDATFETNERYLTLLKPHLYTVLCQIIDKNEKQLSWSQFVQQRQLWITGGSAGGEKILIDGEMRRIDKKVYFETLQSSEIEAWLYSDPKIEASGSEKYEITKPRAIYGATSQSYIIMTYLTKQMESAMNKVDGLEDGLNDLQEIAASHRRVRLSNDPLVHTTMIDYTDFNYQHTMAAQSLMFEVIKDILVAKQCHNDLITAALWCQRACLNQWVKFPMEHEYHRVTQGMFSGIRCTNFMNTILNICYFKCAHQFTVETMGIRPDQLHSIHKGDDVWITNNNLIYAICLFAVMQSCGLAFTDNKQLFGKDAEFLRVRYFSGKAMGYLCRALGSLIERPMQSTDASTPATMLQALRSHINILYRRGLSIEACDLLWEVTLKSWSTIKHKNFDDVTIPRRVVEKSYTLGGLDLGPPSTLPVGGGVSAPLPVQKIICDKLQAQIPLNMTNDYITYLSNQLQEPFRSINVKEHMHNANVMGALSNKEKYIALKHHANELVIWKSQLSTETNVRRCRDTFKEYLNTESYDLQVYDTLRRMSTNYDGIILDDTPGTASSIMRAIHSSPYRDIATAQRATASNIVTAAKICIMENANEILRMSAMQALNTILTYLPYDVVTRILQGIRSGGNNFESILHPIALSWLCGRALDKSIAQAMIKKITTVNEWDTLLNINQQLTINSAVKEETLLTISRY